MKSEDTDSKYHVIKHIEKRFLFYLFGFLGSLLKVVYSIAIVATDRACPVAAAVARTGTAQSVCLSVCLFVTERHTQSTFCQRLNNHWLLRLLSYACLA